MRKSYKEIYVVSGIITVFVFVMGVYVGTLISREKVLVIAKDIEKLAEDLNVAELSFLFTSLYGEKTCEFLKEQFYGLVQHSENIRQDVEYYESMERMKAPAYKETKIRYMHLVLKQWLYFEKMREVCNLTDATVILYFYSNKYCKSCPDQGTVLMWHKQRNWDKLMIFPLDFDLEVDLIKQLGKMHNFTEVKEPVMIIEGKKYEGFVNKENLGKILCETNEAFC